MMETQGAHTLDTRFRQAVELFNFREGHVHHRAAGGARRVQHLRQAMQGVGAEYQVHVRRARTDRGALLPIVAISANSSMVDAPGAPGVALGDTAMLVGRQGHEEIAAAESAQIVGSSYRLLAMIPRAVPRFWAAP